MTMAANTGRTAKGTTPTTIMKVMLSYYAVAVPHVAAVVGAVTVASTAIVASDIFAVTAADAQCVISQI